MSSRSKHHYRHPNPVKYHRVDLGADDDDFGEDDQSILDRELRSKSSGCEVGKCCRSFFIISSVLITIIGLSVVVAYTAIILPESVSIKRGIMHVLHGNSNSNETKVNSTSSENISSSTRPDVKTVPVKGNKTSKHHHKHRPKKNTKSPNPAETNVHLIKKRNKAVEARSYVDWFQNKLDSFDDRELDSFDDRKLHKNEKNEKNLTSTTSKKQVEPGISIEGPFPIPLNRTSTPKTTILVKSTTDGTTVKDDIKNSTKHSTGKGKNATEYNNWVNKIKEGYNDNYEAVVAFGCLTATMMCALALFCILRRIRQKRMAKKRQFTRLVNDLNASEKFTLVTASDEESD